MKERKGRKRKIKAIPGCFKWRVIHGEYSRQDKAMTSRKTFKKRYNKAHMPTKQGQTKHTSYLISIISSFWSLIPQ
jgi:hypothetical protein